MGRTTPLASDAGVLALGRSLFALIALVVVDRLIGELITTILAPTGQFGDGLLYGQVARRCVLADLGTTAWAGRVLITQSEWIDFIFIGKRKEKPDIQGETVVNGKSRVSLGFPADTYLPSASK